MIIPWRGKEKKKKKQQHNTLDLFRGRRADNSPAASELSLHGLKSFDMEGPPVKGKEGSTRRIKCPRHPPIKTRRCFGGTDRLEEFKPEIPGDFWRVERPQVAPVLQEHGVAACPQEGKDPPGPGGAPAIHLPCKAACKALELLPNPPKASSRAWGTRNSELGR